MKVRSSLKSAKNRDKNCKIVRRRGRIYVIIINIMILLERFKFFYSPRAHPSFRGSDPLIKTPSLWSIYIAWPPPCGLLE